MHGPGIGLPWEPTDDYRIFNATGRYSPDNFYVSDLRGREFAWLMIL